jgi:hypothetical protein
MKILIKAGKIKIVALLFIALIASAGTAAPACAMTRAELLPVIFKTLGNSVPADRFSEEEGALTKASAVRLALEAMGWGFEISMYDQITILPEWSTRDSLTEISKNMSPHVPPELISGFEQPLTKKDLPALTEWLKECKKNVSWKASFPWEGTVLTLIKHGIGNPAGPANGDLKKGVNEPLFAAVLTIDMTKIPCQIATAIMVGANKAPLATIAVENYGVVGGVNGGYFAGSKPIGILKRQGYTDNAKFWPHRSAFGWNEKGETVFIDGKEVSEIGKDRRFDKYTEMLQAGPLLVKNGKAADNTEAIKDNVLNLRHPRTIVGTDGKQIMWAVIDGRDNMHSVGTTIDETRKLCRRLGMVTALNLDGGGSSSLWWRGMTFTLPSNSEDSERPIPYAVLMFQEGAGVRQ